MGCGSSKISVISPVPGSIPRNEPDALTTECCRGDSAVSKHTTDSGLGLEAGEVLAPLPGPVPRKLPPLKAPSSCLVQERQESREILEQLLIQGIIPGPPRTGASGESFSVMVDGSHKPPGRPPQRLESLMTRKEQPVTTEDIEARMRKAADRRKTREEELRQRLRTRSARLRGPTRPMEDKREEDDSYEEESHHTCHDLRQGQASMPNPQRKGSHRGEEDLGRLTASLEMDTTFQQACPTAEDDGLF